MRHLLPALLLALTALAADDVPNLLANPSLEPGPDGAVAGWTLGELSAWTTDPVRTGTNAVRVKDESAELGSGFTSASVPVQAEQPYTIEVWSYAIAGSGVGIYVQCFDAAGKGLSAPVEQYHRVLPSRKHRWSRTAYVIRTPKDCASVRLWLHSYSGSIAEVVVDDLSVRAGALVTEKKAAGMKSFDPIPVHVATGPRPSVLVNRQELAAMQEAAGKYPWAKTALEAFLKGAENRLNHPTPLPDRGGGWYHWYACPKDGAGLKTVSLTEHKCPKCGAVYTGEPYDTVAIMGEHNTLARNIRDFGLAFALTGREEFAKAAREILVAYADRYAGYEMHDVRGPSTRGSAGKVGPQTLDESVWLIPVAQGYDCVVDTMGAPERDHVERDLLRAAVAVIQRNNAGISNWQSWHNAAIGAAAFALRDRELADAAINGRSGFQFQMANSVTDDGFWYEGSWGYHYYALSAHLDLSEMAARSGMDLYANPRYKGLYQASLQFMAPSQILPAFHDGHLAGGLAGSRFYEVAYRRWQDPVFAWAVNQRTRGWDSLLYGVPEVPASVLPHQDSVDFTGLGWAVLRSGASRDGMYLALDYGPHGGGHGHPDKLGFSFYSLGDFLAHDPGCVAYGLPIHSQWYRQTVSHNTVVVDGKSQEECTGELDYFLASPRMAVVSATADEANGAVRFRRLALLTSSLLLLVDDLADEEAHQYDWALHGVGAFTTALPLGRRAEPAGTDHGYQHIENVTATPALGSWQADWTSPKRSFRLTMLADDATPTEVIAGQGWGPSSLGKVPMVLARRQAKSTRYVAALQPYRGDAPQLDLAARPVGDGLLVTARTAHGQTLALRGTAGTPLVTPEATMDGAFAAVERGDDVQNALLVDGRLLTVGTQCRIALNQPGSLAVERLRQGLWFVRNDIAEPRELRLEHADCAPARAYVLTGTDRTDEVAVSSQNGAWSLRLPASSQVEICVSGASLAEFRTAAAIAAAEAAEEANRAHLPGIPTKLLAPPANGQPAKAAITIQAEDFSGQGGGEVKVSDQKRGAEGTSFLMWNNPGHWVEWTFTVPETAAYQLEVRYCTDQKSAERAILIDGAYPAAAAQVVAFPDTGGFSNDEDNWRTLVLPDPLWLAPGPHALRIYNLREPANLDWLRLAPWQATP